MAARRYEVARLARELAQGWSAKLRPSRPDDRGETPAMRRRAEQDDFELRRAAAMRAAIALWLDALDEEGGQ